MHFGKFNQGRAFTVNGRSLHSVVEQRELGSTSLSFPESCNTVRQCDECNTACLPSLVRELTIKKLYVLCNTTRCWCAHSWSSVLQSGHSAIGRMSLTGMGAEKIHETVTGQEG